MQLMKELLNYINELSPKEQVHFAIRCGTSISYLRKAISINQKIGEKIALNIDRESCGAVTCDSIRPDVDWAYLRGTKKAA